MEHPTQSPARCQSDKMFSVFTISLHAYNLSGAGSDNFIPPGASIWQPVPLGLPRKELPGSLVLDINQQTSPWVTSHQAIKEQRGRSRSSLGNQLSSRPFLLSPARLILQEREQRPRCSYTAWGLGHGDAEEAEAQKTCGRKRLDELFGANISFLAGDQLDEQASLNQESCSPETFRAFDGTNHCSWQRRHGQRKFKGTPKPIASSF